MEGQLLAPLLRVVPGRGITPGGARSAAIARRLRPRLARRDPRPGTAPPSTSRAAWASQATVFQRLGLPRSGRRGLHISTAEIRQNCRPSSSAASTSRVASFSCWAPAPPASERAPRLDPRTFQEVRAHLHDNQAGRDLAYLRFPSGLLVDFIWQWGDRRVGLEVKASERWRSSHRKGTRSSEDQALLEDSGEAGLGVLRAPW